MQNGSKLATVCEGWQAFIPDWALKEPISHISAGADKKAPQMSPLSSQMLLSLAKGTGKGQPS